jgi:uncharacterized membrane protein YdjX (TVP38/TMEM64 family)
MTDIESGRPTLSKDKKNLHPALSGQKAVLSPPGSRPYLWIKSLVWLVIIYFFLFFLVLWCFQRLPQYNVAAEGEDVLKIPQSFDEMRQARARLQSYKEEHEGDILLFLGVSYVFLQAFMIPGPAVLNLLIGSLYSSIWKSLLIVIVFSFFGTSANYLLVKNLLKDPITAIIPKRITIFKSEIAKHQQSLFSYMLFIRLTPILPHWFVSLACPIIGVPYVTFLSATILGHIPMNLVAIHGGATLSSLNSFNDLYNTQTVIFLVCVACLALIPIFWKRLYSWASNLRRKSTVKL